MLGSSDAKVITFSRVLLGIPMCVIEVTCMSSGPTIG
jgi:hypothetical protein